MHVSTYLVEHFVSGRTIKISHSGCWTFHFYTSQHFHLFSWCLEWNLLEGDNLPNRLFTFQAILLFSWSAQLWFTTFASGWLWRWIGGPLEFVNGKSLEPTCLPPGASDEPWLWIGEGQGDLRLIRKGAQHLEPQWATEPPGQDHWPSSVIYPTLH